MEMLIHVDDHPRTTTALLLQLEQVTKEVKVGKNSEIRLTEMDKDRDMQDDVWVEVAQTNSLELQ